MEQLPIEKFLCRFSAIPGRSAECNPTWVILQSPWRPRRGRPKVRRGDSGLGAWPHVLAQTPDESSLRVDNEEALTCWFTAAARLGTVGRPRRGCFVIGQQQFVELTHGGQVEALEDAANLFPQPTFAAHFFPKRLEQQVA